MGLVPIWRALLNPQGEILLRETERAKRDAWLQHIAGGEIEVIYRRVPRQRTPDQNKFLHAAPFRIIADATGDCIEDVKRNLMGELFGYIREIETGLAKPWREHTASMTDEEASHMIEWLPAFALEKFNGLELPLPGEVLWK